MSTKSATKLSKKFGIQAGQRVCLLNPPDDAIAVLTPTLPEDVQIMVGTAEAQVDIVLFWPQTLHQLAERFAELQLEIVPDGAIWAMIPKKKFAKKRNIDFSWEMMQAAGLETDLVDNKIASFSEQDYGTRFVIRKHLRDKYRSTNQ